MFSAIHKARQLWRTVSRTFKKIIPLEFMVLKGNAPEYSMPFQH